MGAKQLRVCGDSLIVTSLVVGTYQAKDISLQKYLAKVKELAKEFEQFAVRYVPRE